MGWKNNTTKDVCPNSNQFPVPVGTYYNYLPSEINTTLEIFNTAENWVSARCGCIPGEIYITIITLQR